jgi:thiol-disulfide isomerase/thioredoxin
MIPGLAWTVVDLLFAVVVLAALLAVTVGLGLLLRWRQGRPRRANPSEAVDPARLGAPALGEAATLLQFSTEFCARCPGVHRTLSEIAGERSGVVHLDVDLTHRPDIARHFQVLQTPTTLILDREGVIRTRFGGTPGRDVIELELARVTEEPTRV